MAALPQNSTGRFLFDYITGGAPTSQEHTCAVRVTPDADASQPQADFLALLTAMGTARFATGWRVLRVRYQAAGTNFSVPLTLATALASFAGTGGTISPPNEAIESTYQGRSFVTGRRVDLSLYGVVGFALTTQYRLTAAEAPWLTGAVAAINAATTYSYRAIDGTVPTWYVYLNWNYNSYWERRLRV